MIETNELEKVCLQAYILKKEIEAFWACPLVEVKNYLNFGKNDLYFMPVLPYSS